MILYNSNSIHLNNRKKTEYFPWLRHFSEQMSLCGYKIRTNFTLSSGVSFITGTYIRWNTCSTILTLWIANSWNNHVKMIRFLSTLLVLKFSSEQFANPSKRSLNFNTMRNTVRIFCTISTYTCRYISCTLRFEPFAYRAVSHVMLTHS